MINLGGVGGWFHTAADVAAPAWEPGDGGFGHVLPGTDLTVALNLSRGRLTIVLTGAGTSTDSSLPDYRGRNAVPRSPMTFQEFTDSDLNHRRYWVRPTVGWSWFETTRPGLAHLVLVGPGRHAPSIGVVTQNVDELHQTVGSEPAVDLHGNLARAVYLGCGRLSGHAELRVRLLKLNPEIAVQLGSLSERARIAPDGDAEVESMTGFTYPACPVYGGILKPDIVYFGENARREVVEAANALSNAAEVLPVLGSTLAVMSGLRFIHQAVKQDKDAIIVGDNVARADDLVTLCVHGRLEHILPSWAGVLRAG